MADAPRGRSPGTALARRDAASARHDATTRFATHHDGEGPAGQIVEAVVNHMPMLAIYVCAVLHLEGMLPDGRVGRAVASEIPRTSEGTDRPRLLGVQASVRVPAPTAAMVGACLRVIGVPNGKRP